MTILCGDDECESVRCRDYAVVEFCVAVIQQAVQTGFDTRSDDAYEFFASDGMLGDPDDLSHYEYLHMRSQVLDLARDAIDHLDS